MGVANLPSASCSPARKQRGRSGEAMLMLRLTKSMKCSFVVQQERRKFNRYNYSALTWSMWWRGNVLVTSTFHCFYELFSLLEDSQVQFSIPY